ncbi:MAG: cyclic nucleotide-binding domain-containing protein [Deltaproteobacteria bacterium]|nr:cyclic nucleotide-binding domain-containing protein [Deltaproteobacteria bacterium]
MPTRLSEIYQKADSRLLEEKHDQALTGFANVARADPEHILSRFKIAQALEGLKESNRAFEVYKALAWHCTKAGFPLMGLVATKRAAQLQAGFEDTLSILAELYSLESDRIDQSLSLFALPELHGELEIEPEEFSPDRLVHFASKLGQEFPDPRYPKMLPPIPLFSMLTSESFFPILEILHLRTYQPGETIIKQGTPCSSVYMLACGEVEITELQGNDEHVLARLPTGSVFGEMALISEAPRVASAICIKESAVLELRRDELESAAEDLDDITWATAKFIRQRFLHNILLTSPVFKPFPPGDRKEILDRFTSVGVPTDEVIIEEGSPGPGLYVILGGEVEVSKFDGDTRVHLARLAEGAILGEISLVQDTPTTATVQAVRGGEFLFLAREDFQELIQERPQIRQALEALSAERLDEQRQSMYEAGLVSADGSVLF